MKNQTNTKLIVRSSLALALALAVWSPAQAQSAEPAKAGNMTKAKMMEHCQEMKEQKQKLKEDGKAQDDRLTGQLSEMNRAPEDKKMGLMATVLTNMVEQRITMDARKAKMEEAMMKHMHLGKETHVAVSDDEGYGRKLGGCPQGTSIRTEMIAERRDTFTV